MADTTYTKVVADTVTCTVDGITFDIAADSNVLLPGGQHTVNKWNSQKIKAQGIVKDGTYESTTLTVTFDSSQYNTIESDWKSAKKVVYTVGSPFNKTYNDCIVRVSSTPTLSPGKDDYVTFQLEISCLENISGS